MLFFCWLPFWCCMPFALTETKNLAEGAFPVSATGSVGEEFALRAHRRSRKTPRPDAGEREGWRVGVEGRCGAKGSAKGGEAGGT